MGLDSPVTPTSRVTNADIAVTMAEMQGQIALLKQEQGFLKSLLTDRFATLDAKVDRWMRKVDEWTERHERNTIEAVEDISKSPAGRQTLSALQSLAERVTTLEIANDTRTRDEIEKMTEENLRRAQWWRGKDLVAWLAVGVSGALLIGQLLNWW